MKKIISLVCMAAFIILTTSFPAYASELNDGAYTVGRETSYVNPETGETEDGGTNIALGDSMCASIVDDRLLVEQTDGKTYVTIGIGLMSNIEDVRIQVKDSSGQYRDAEITKTGSCQRDNDTCNHYRFEVYSADEYISPIIYVTPMGRDVQFFVMPDISSAKKGTGNFVSEMIKETTTVNTTESTTKKATTKAATTEQTTVTETSVTETTVSETTTDVTKDTVASQDKNNNKIGWIIGGVVAAVVAVSCTVYFIKKKQKQGDVQNEL